MNRRMLLNLALLIVVAGLAALAWFRPGVEQETERPKLTELDPATVTQASIERGEQAVRLEKRDGRWYLAQEPPLPADEYKVERLLEILKAEVQRSYAAGDMDLAKLDLDPPRVVVRFDELELKLGGTEPLEYLRYVLKGDRVLLVRDLYQTAMDANRLNYVDRKLLPEGAEIEAIELPDMKISRKEAGGWQIEPQPKGVSADAVNALVDAWRHATAIKVEDYAEGEKPRPVKVVLAGDAVVEFELDSARDRHILARPDLRIQYVVSETTVEELTALKTEATAGP